MRQNIYIPLWLDLLYQAYRQARRKARNLHSTMVRFIIYKNESDDGSEEFIYSPLWLDLLCRQQRSCSCGHDYLHSTMVRFIICF